MKVKKDKNILFKAVEKAEVLLYSTVIAGCIYLTFGRRIIKDIRKSRNDKRRQTNTKKTYRGIGGQHSVDPW